MITLRLRTSPFPITNSFHFNLFSFFIQYNNHMILVSQIHPYCYIILHGWFLSFFCSFMTAYLFKLGVIISQLLGGASLLIFPIYSRWRPFDQRRWLLLAVVTAIKIRPVSTCILVLRVPLTIWINRAFWLSSWKWISL